MMLPSSATWHLGLNILCAPAWMSVPGCGALWCAKAKWCAWPRSCLPWRGRPVGRAESACRANVWTKRRKNITQWVSFFIIFMSWSTEASRPNRGSAFRDMHGHSHQRASFPSQEILSFHNLFKLRLPFTAALPAAKHRKTCHQQGFLGKSQYFTHKPIFTPQSRASVVHFGSSLLKASYWSYQKVSTELCVETVTEEALCSLTISCKVPNGHLFLTENHVMLEAMAYNAIHSTHCLCLVCNLKQAIRSLYFLVKIVHTVTPTTVSRIPPVVSPQEEI